MAIAADRDGFLIGERAQIDVAAYGKQLALLRSLDERLADIAGDTAHIRQSMVRPSRGTSAGNAMVSRGESRAAVSVSRAASQVPRPTALAIEIQRVVQQSDPRDGRGRFVSAERRTTSRSAEGGRVDAAGTTLHAGARRLGEAAGALKQGVAGVVDGMETVDPTIAATKEASAIVAPLLRPVTGLFKGLFGRDREDKTFGRTVPWYRRIVGELRDLNKKSGGGGGLKLSGLGGLLLKLPGIGWLGRMLGGLGGALGPLIKLAGKASLPLAAMFSSIKSFNTSTEEYAQRMGVELNGSLAQALGVRFAGVLGDFGNTLTFGLAGKFGETIAPHVVSAFEAVGAAWDSTTGWIKDKFGAALTTFDGVIGKLSGLVDKAGAWIGEQWQDIKGKAGELYDGAKDAAAKIGDKAVELRDAAVEKASEFGAQAADAAKNAVTAVTGGRYKGGSNANRAALVEAMNGAGIKDPQEQAMFMAQMDHESGGFKSYEENLNYGAAGLRKTFGKYFKTDAEAQQYARNPEAIANKVYGGRMGNTEAGDGWKFRGRGAVQLTGRDNYTAAGKALGLDLVGNPDLAKDPAVAAKVATWYWKQRNLGMLAQDGNVEGVTRKINGGTNGLADRAQKYRHYLAEAREGQLTVQTANDSRAIPPPAVTGAISAARPGARSAVQPIGVLPITGRAAQKAPSVPSTPSVMMPVASGGSGKSESLVIETPLTQNVADRGIAATATGGLGMH